MSFQADGYFYNKQLTKYIMQFMAVFDGLQVSVGKTSTVEAGLIPVPIRYGAPDRVAAAITAGNNQNQPIRIPILSGYMIGINIARDRMHGTGVERRKAFVPLGGLVPDDITVIHQRVPVPYDLEMELGIYVSNTDQHCQILEQILPLFDPQLNIQTSDGLFDMTRLTSLELINVNVDTNYPVGLDGRVIQSTLRFKLPIWLSIPADVRSNFVEKIFVRVGAIDESSITNYEIVADLDGQSIPYTLQSSSPPNSF